MTTTSSGGNSSSTVSATGQLLALNWAELDAFFFIADSQWRRYTRARQAK